MAKCPKCNSELTKIVYGLPTPETAESAERGEIMLGGCCISPFSPSFYCKNCHIEYSGDLKKTYDTGKFEGLDRYEPEEQLAELVEIADKLLDMKECPVIRTRFKDEF